MVDTRRASFSSIASSGVRPRRSSRTRVPLLLGVAANAAVLLQDSELTRSDLWLGAVVLLSGLSLLVLLEVWRRS